MLGKTLSFHLMASYPIVPYVAFPYPSKTSSHVLAPLIIICTIKAVMCAPLEICLPNSHVLCHRGIPTLRGSFVPVLAAVISDNTPSVSCSQLFPSRQGPTICQAIQVPWLLTAHQDILCPWLGQILVIRKSGAISYLI